MDGLTAVAVQVPHTLYAKYLLEQKLFENNLWRK